MAEGGAGAEENIAHFLTIEDLARVHERIFEPGAALFLVGEYITWIMMSPAGLDNWIITERPLVNLGSGLATATLRVRDQGNPDYQAFLQDAFVELFSLYGPGYFNVSVTGNVILQSNVNQRYSAFFGQGKTKILPLKTAAVE
jgi:hypothetical protein